MVIARRLCAAALVAWLAACDAPRCDPEEACDVRSPACQRAALRLASCLREQDADADVDVRLVKRHELLQKWMQEALVEGDDPGERSIKRGLALLGLAANEQPDVEIELEIDRIGAYYEDETKRVTIIDRGQPLDSIDNWYTLVHEMVHALQDAAGDLAHDDDVQQRDAWLAVRSLVEGEATLLTDQAYIEGLGWGSLDEVDYPRALLPPGLARDADDELRQPGRTVDPLPIRLRRDLFAQPRRSARAYRRGLRDSTRVRLRRDDG